MLNFILPKLCLKVEKWKWNKEYRIYVSNFGQFKNEHKQPLPIKIANNGYCMVLTASGLKLAHRIVMLTWVPIPNAEELTVDHLDHNKRNNAVDNLEWVTKEENWKRAIEDYVGVVDAEKETTSAATAIPQTEIAHPIIKAGKRAFTSYGEAAEWLIEEMKMDTNTVSTDKIIRKIKGAIQSESTYCNRKWKILL